MKQKIFIILTLFICFFLSDMFLAGVASASQFYQENADSYTCTGKWDYSWPNPCPWVYDGSWLSGGRGTVNILDSPNYGTLYINYTKPVGALPTSKWIVADIGIHMSLSIPAGCWALNPLQFKVDSRSVSTSYVNWSCYDGASWTILRSAVYDYAKEEAMKWDFDNCQNHNVWGWAWSENIGWISASCENCDTNNPNTESPDGKSNGAAGCPASGTDISNYGLDINETTGLISGYAWSENIGWISFNSTDLISCPSVPCPAQVNPTNGQISGWARAYRAIVPEGQTLGGWDGWIKLRGSNYGLWLDTSVNPTEFRDWAWGGDKDSDNNKAVIGLTSFNRANCDINKNGIYEGASEGAPVGCPTSGTAYNYKVMTSASFTVVPTVSNLQATQINGCGGVIERFIWDYSGNTQAAFWLKAFDGVTETSSNWVPSSDHQGDLVLDYSKSYTWQLNVKDNIGTESGWTSGPDFNTSGLWPSPNFTWITISEKTIRVTSNTTINCSSCSYFWEFKNGDGTSASPASSSLAIPPDITFTSAGNVTLTATSSVGSCTIIKPISSFLPPPNWIEIPPF